MQKIQTDGSSCSVPTTPDVRQRSLLSSLFLLSLGVIYPGFLCLIFLKPELIEQLFGTFSGYVISGLGLTLLGACFILATMHFRTADHQYRQASDTSTSSLPIPAVEVQH